MKTVLAIMALGALALVLAAGPAAGGYVPVYGGLTYDPATGTGYPRAKVPDDPSQLVNNAGTAVDSAFKLISGAEKGLRAVRWDASGATELGDLGTQTSGVSSVRAFAINDADTAVGGANKYVSGVSKGARAVRWDASGAAATELGNLGTQPSGWTNACATSINNSGTSVGWAYKYVSGNWKGSGAVRWDASGTAATELRSPWTTSSGGSYAYANFINDAGIAVGRADKYISDVNMGVRAVRWDASGTDGTELGDLGTDASGLTYAFIYVINNSGTAVGLADKYVSGVLMGARAVRWDASSTAATELGNLGTDPSGYSSCYASVINEAGTTVGQALKYVTGISKGSRAVRWDASGTAATELGILGTDPSGNSSSYASDLNNWGITVGKATLYDGSGQSLGDRAAMWGLDGTAMDLNTLIDPDSNWTLTWARGISDTGWIAGYGNYDPDGTGPLAAYDRLFIMQVPEPATLALVGLGAAATLLRRRK